MIKYVIHYTLINVVSNSLFWGTKDCDNPNTTIEELKNFKDGNWVFNKVDKVEQYEVKDDNICPKCEGTGYIPKFVQYRGGICYSCNGTGKLKKRGWR